MGSDKVVAIIIKEEIEKAKALSEKISRYPAVADTIRETMRLLLDARGIISHFRINEEAMNIYLTNMLVSDEGLITTERLREEKLAPEIVSKYTKNYLEKLTDYYFANTFSDDMSELIIFNSEKYNNQYATIIEEVYRELKEKRSLGDLYSFSSELMDDATPFVTDVKVNLIRSYFSDHLNFIGIAKKYFTLRDLIEIKSRIYGKGKIGGKAAGILLAKKILSLKENDNDDHLINSVINVPDFFVLGSDQCYEFLIYNGLLQYRSIRYNEPETMEYDYKKLQEDFRSAKFHPRTRAYFLEILEQLNNEPYVARSSSRLEDAIGFSFAGKYTSIFCPNKGDMETQLDYMEQAVKEIFISMYNPAVLAYRSHNRLLDYEERIAVIFQKVVGRTLDDEYFFPTMAGVAFSLNPYCWSERIKKEDGMLRLVMGFGSRAVDRVGSDYARIVPLTEPMMRPEIDAKDIKKYSQKNIDVMNMKKNEFETVPFSEIARYFDEKDLSYFVSIDDNDHLKEPIGVLYDKENAFLTFSKLLGNSDFPEIMKKILKKLERHIGGPVDVEFSVEIDLSGKSPDFMINIIQCRRFNLREEMRPALIPRNIPEEKKLFYSTYSIPNGEVTNIEYIVYVDPKNYDNARSFEEKYAVSRAISGLNRLLKGKTFVLLGPGRWGSNDINLGVKINYGDISNTRMLMEIAYEKGGLTPEVSYGTHFFLDLVEGKIIVVPLYPDKQGTFFDRDFIMSAHNLLSKLLPGSEASGEIVRVVNIPQAVNGEYLQIKMNSNESIAIGYFAAAEQEVKASEDAVLLPM